MEGMISDTTCQEFCASVCASVLCQHNQVWRLFHDKY
jgi:hypothetical protein